MTNFNGSYGFVLKLDGMTENLAKWLSQFRQRNRELTNFQASQEFPDFIPEFFHLTLFHAKIKDAPEAAILEILDALSFIRNGFIKFTQIAVYGEKFLFWDAEQTTYLRAGHMVALHLADFLDPQAVSRAEEEGLQLSDDERQSIRRYGHPLTRKLFRPHVTLGYNASGFGTCGLIGPYNPPPAGIQQVFFAEIGDYGSIKRIVF